MTDYTSSFQSRIIRNVSLTVACSICFPDFSIDTRVIAMCFWRSVKNLTFSGTITRQLNWYCPKCPTLTLNKEKRSNEASYDSRDSFDNEDLGKRQYTLLVI